MPITDLLTTDLLFTLRSWLDTAAELEFLVKLMANLFDEVWLAHVAPAVGYVSVALPNGGSVLVELGEAAQSPNHRSVGFGRC